MELTITFFIKFTLVVCFVLSLNYLLELVYRKDKLDFSSLLQLILNFTFFKFLFFYCLFGLTKRENFAVHKNF